MARTNDGTNNIVVGGQVWPVLIKQKPVECEQPPNGMSVPSITYNGETYYKDSEGFIYKQPLPNNDIPIGFWKNKTQSITFY